MPTYEYVNKLQETCSIQLSASPNPVIMGNITELIATIIPAGMYNVTFKDGTDILGTTSSDTNGEAKLYWLVTDTFTGLHNISAQTGTPIQCQDTLPVFVNNPPILNDLGIVLVSAILSGAIIFTLARRNK